MSWKTALVASTLAVFTFSAAAVADAVVITSQYRTVKIGHNAACADNHNVTAKPFAPFEEHFLSPLLNCSLVGEDSAMQNSTVSTSQLAGSGHSALSADGVGSTIYYHQTYSRYIVGFEILEPQHFMLTGSVSAMIVGPGGYHEAKARLTLVGPNGGYGSTLTAWSQTQSHTDEIKVEGVLEPGAYTLTASADNYFDLGISPGLKLESLSSFEFELDFVDATPSVPGDLTGDGSVGVEDLLILLGQWGPCDDPRDCPADLDGNGVVDVFDLLILLENWG